MIPSYTLGSNTMIYLEFPEKFDQLLGEKLKCKSIGGITSEIGCTIVERILTISGISEYVPSFDNPIVLQISG